MEEKFEDTEYEFEDEECEFEDEEDEFDEDNNMIIRAKWSIDGAKTIKEIAEKLRGFADYVESLDFEWTLTDEVDDDYAFLKRKETLLKN